MPGLAGFSKKYIGIVEAKNVLQKMRNLITHYDFYVKDELFCDDFVSATRAHVNIIQKQPQPYCANGVYIWLDGEFCNHEELKVQYGITADADPKLLAGLYSKDNNFTFLKSIDGLYSAVLYDSIRMKLHLITDRYGFRHLYYMVKDSSIVWGSEVKVMLAFPNFKPMINKQSASQFFGIGYLLENNTWFENVELVPSGTVISWDLTNDTMSNYRYWWWDEIKPITGKLNETEIADELGRLFDDAVKRRSGKGERVGVTLSGGLDSRAILAAMPTMEYPINAVTFGKKDCDDARIAAMAAHTKGAQHHVYELTQTNWLQPRISGVWLTDGQLDLMHMHGIEARNFIKELFDINLDGFLGGSVFGGSYMKNKWYMERNLDKSIAAEAMDCGEELVTNCEGYINLPKSDYYFIQNRGRRFILGGTKHSLSIFESRKPFFDNKLIEFAYSLPDSYRFDHRIYSKMLLRKYPEFYKKIPWQNTGLPISSSFFKKFLCKAKGRIFDKLTRLGVKLNKNRGYTDYPNWIREDTAWSFFNQVLRDPNALYPEFISSKIVLSDLDAHFNRNNKSVNLCRYLTFEIWLQQVFRGEYRE